MGEFPLSLRPQLSKQWPPQCWRGGVRKLKVVCTSPLKFRVLGYPQKSVGCENKHVLTLNLNSFLPSQWLKCRDNLNYSRMLSPIKVEWKYSCLTKTALVYLTSWSNRLSVQFGQLIIRCSSFRQKKASFHLPLIKYFYAQPTKKFFILSWTVHSLSPSNLNMLVLVQVCGVTKYKAFDGYSSYI